MNMKFLAESEGKVLTNAWELWKESSWLFELGHYPRAYALAHLSFEETAKSTILQFLGMDIFDGGEVSHVQLQEVFSGRLFNNHKYKLRIAFLRLPDFDFQTAVNLINGLNQLKNRSLYTDIFDGKLMKPGDFFGQQQASQMLELASNTIRCRLNEIGIDDLDRIDLVTVERLEQHYRHLWLNFKLQFHPLNAVQHESYIDLLERIITNKDLFDQLKMIWGR